ILGITPEVKGKDPIAHSLATAEQPASALAESFRSLRTNLLFSSVDGVPQVLALTSAMPSEGKSSSCMNLATAFAQADNKVLIVDADMRKPTAHKRLKLDNALGLSNFLTHQADISDVIQATPIDNVSVITAGPLSPNPSELLSSKRIEEIFQLAPTQFDLVILDCPPVMGLADALVLANKANATLLVSAFGQTSKRAIQDANERLRQARANLIGALFTKVKTGGGYGYSYEYSYYSYGEDRLKHEKEGS
ncbi:MAG: CpsD/CapB family tyrosine-protein kinase, partial [Leucothrix sp.]